MIVGLEPGERVALDLDGHQVAGAYVRIGRRDEQLEVDHPVMGRHRADAAIVKLDDGQMVATPYYLLELPQA